MSRRRNIRVRNHILGIAFLLVLVFLAWLAIAVYDKRFTTTAAITLRADRVGNQLKPHADVKVRGMVVGSVRAVRVTDAGVDVEMALQPDKLDRVPRNVSARLLPKTLFGQRYVSLIIPDAPDRHRLADGDVVDQDRTPHAIELEKALRDLMPVLQAVQPQKLADTLGAISQALDGRGKQIGTTITDLNAYFAQLNPKMPELQADITKFADTLAGYEKAGPDIVEALSEMTTTSRTIAEQRQSVAELLTAMTSASDDLTGFVKSNKDTLIRLSDTSRPTLELLARYSPEFPCLLESVNKLKPSVEKVLGAGTNEPGLHVNLLVKPSRGPYVPGKDKPVFTATGGPKCYGANGTATQVANSPEENRFIAELLAPVHGTTPAEMPQWGSLLVGPLLRGAEVTIR
ncbi:ABC transporter substrate-binding protein [Actinosynnema sp. ALI-1.44]|uniref:MCE family protein n=1 Tax=Actinosynnema sp. ALI-1.44 TaxID=1933779 RepID=UPI00097BB0DA|nr:MCE family protein [Actinosynnema sp. ALI-1.44]ONI84061.1 ABC transporter substrate-binding protein [Actinosynnema sp. ALI-1.44]